MLRAAISRITVGARTATRNFSSARAIMEAESKAVRDAVSGADVDFLEAEIDRLNAKIATLQPYNQARRAVLYICVATSFSMLVCSEGGGFLPNTIQINLPDKK